MQKLFAYAGNYKYLTIVSWILSAVSALIALLPFYDIWRIMQEVVLAAPDYNKARNLSGLGWSAVGFALLSMIIYICALLCSHIAAFHVQANMRSTLMRHILTLPMGFMDSEGSGKIRKIVNESTAATETYLAHQLPDKAGAMATPGRTVSIASGVRLETGAVKSGTRGICISHHGSHDRTTHEG